MPLTALITTSDGVEHQAHGLVYPLEIQTYPEVSVRVGLHGWHSEQARLDGRAELTGFPYQFGWVGEEAEQRLGAALGALSGVTDPAQIIPTIIDTLEKVIIAEDARFSQIAAG